MNVDPAEVGNFVLQGLETALNGLDLTLTLRCAIGNLGRILELSGLRLLHHSLQLGQVWLGERDSLHFHLT